MPLIWDWRVEGKTGCLRISHAFMKDGNLLTKVSRAIGHNLLSRLENIDTKKAIQKQRGYKENNWKYPGDALN